MKIIENWGWNNQKCHSWKIDDDFQLNWVVEQRHRDWRLTTTATVMKKIRTPPTTYRHNQHKKIHIALCKYLKTPFFYRISTESHYNKSLTKGKVWISSFFSLLVLFWNVNRFVVLLRSPILNSERITAETAFNFIIITMRMNWYNLDRRCKPNEQYDNHRND